MMIKKIFFLSAFLIAKPCLHAQALTLDKASYATESVAKVSWAGASGNGSDWVGIYKQGQKPGEQESQSWSYLGGTQEISKSVKPAGSLELTMEGLAAGKYQVYLLERDGFSVLSGPVDFLLSEAIEIASNKSRFAEGESISVSYKGGSGDAKEWIGIYLAEQEPKQGSPALAWFYTDNTKNGERGSKSGRVEFVNPELPVGEYVTYLFKGEGYDAIAGPLDFKVLSQNKVKKLAKKTVLEDLSGALISIGSVTLILKE